MAKSEEKKHDVAIHWFRNGLRFHDNPCLLDACQKSESLLPIYVVDPEFPFAQTAGCRAGTIRANFLLESINEVDEKLRKMGSQLVVVLGKSHEVLPEIVATTQAKALFYEQEAAAPVREQDAETIQAIKNRLKRDGKNYECKFEAYATHTLHPMERYLAQCKDHTAPSTYGSFTKIFNKMSVAKEVNEVKEVPSLPNKSVKLLEKSFAEALRMPTLKDLGYAAAADDMKNSGKGGYAFAGGENAAIELLAKNMARSQWVATFEKPKTSPNDATRPSTTALSPYVKHGCISPRRFYHELSKVYSKYNNKETSKPPVSLHGQLMWRDFNYLVGYSTPNFDKMIDNPIARQIPWDDDPDLLLAWKMSKTGYPYIDAIMTQLRETGWIHHLARHSVACFLTRGDLWQSWEDGATVFEEYLIDADWSINNFNWQWLSCTAHFYQYFRCYSPIAFGKKTDPNGDYIRKWLPQFKDMPAKYIYEPWEAPIELQKKVGVIVGENYPHPIVDHKLVSKNNMSRMKEAYDAQKNGEPMPANESPSSGLNRDTSQKRQRHN